jgi:O-antigen/teichoic acid export membrane protein
MSVDLPGTPDAPDTAAAPQDDVAAKVVRGGAIRTIGFGITNVIALVSAAILAHYLGPADFGRYGSVLALVAIVSGVLDAGLNTIGGRDLALHEGDERRDLTRVLLGIRLLLATIGIGASIAVALALGFDRTMTIGTVIAAIAAVLVAAQATLCLPALVDLQNLRLLLVEIARQLYQLIGTVLLVVTGLGLSAFFGLQAVVALLLVLSLPLIVGPGALLRPKRDLGTWQRLAREAWPVAIAGAVSVLYLKVIVLIGSVTLSPTDQGLLVMCTRAVEILSALPMLIVGVALPVVSRAARDDHDRLRYVAQRLLEAALILGILISLPLSIGAETALRILGGGEQYVPAAAALQIQAWMVLTVFIVQACVTLLISLHRHRAILVANLVGLVSICVAAGVLLPLEGLIGGSVAVVIADAILVSASLGFVLMTSQLRGRLGLGLIPRILAAAAGAAAAGILIPVPNAIAATLSGLAFAVLLLVFGGAPPEARALLRARAS